MKEPFIEGSNVTVIDVLNSTGHTLKATVLSYDEESIMYTLQLESGHIDLFKSYQVKGGKEQ